MLSTWHAFILGLVEGITEFLPISSTAHLIMAADLLRVAQTDFAKSFEIIIQLGAIVSVIVLYWKKFLNWEICKRVVAAFIPTGIIGLACYHIVKRYLIGNTAVLTWALILGGVFLIAFEVLHPTPFGDEDEAAISRDIASMSYRHCAIIGLFQAVAMVPGVSRSAATIVGGLAVGLRRRTVVEFSFLLAVPTMLAATGLDLIKNAGTFSASDAEFLTIGFVVAFVTAIVSIKFLLRYVRNHTFTGFGIYRILAALLFVVVK